MSQAMTRDAAPANVTVELPRIGYQFMASVREDERGEVDVDVERLSTRFHQETRRTSLFPRHPSPQNTMAPLIQSTKECSVRQRCECTDVHRPYLSSWTAVASKDHEKLRLSLFKNR